MSTSPIQAHPSWKQEVNRRLAEHRGRKPAAAPAPPAPVTVPSASRRVQEAAARVAARYANAPSFNEALATEARAALRAAEAASEAALHARAAARSVLDGIEAASAARPAVEAFSPAPIAAPPQPVVHPVQEPISDPILDLPQKETMGKQANENEPLSIRWMQELPARAAEPAELRANQGDNLFEDEWWKPASAEPLGPGAGEVDIVEPAQPIHGNLIEFPRELVATHKLRSRPAEVSPEPTETNLQLSIFEVDPVTIDLDAAEAAANQTAAAGPAAGSAVVPWSEPAWSQPAWPRIQLDEPDPEAVAAILEEPAPRRAPAHEVKPASIDRRCMAVVFDGALIAGAVLAAAALALDKVHVLPSMRAFEFGSVAAFAITAALYLALFFTLAESTPGMKYARIRLCTFDGSAPTRAQRGARLAAMVLSIVPAGLGLVWSFFDEKGLSWHDRLSGTYLRNR